MAAAGIALATLGDAELRRSEERTTRAPARSTVGPSGDAAAAPAIGLRVAARDTAAGPSGSRPQPSAAASARSRQGAASELAAERDHEREARDGPVAGSDPGPRVALEPLVAEAGRVSAPLRGDDPGGPRALVLWRLVDGRAARSAEGTSRSDGSLAFPEVLLAGRGELFVTGARVGADLAARLPGDRIAVPAPLADEAGDDTMQGSSEQEVTR